MAKFKNPTNGLIEEIGNPELNPELISGKTKVSDTSSLGVLTSNDLKLTPEFNPIIPATPQTSDISKLDTSFTLGKEEKKAQDFSEEIRKINESFLGRTAFQAEQEKEAGIPQLEKTQSDLTAQLKMFQNEMLDLQNKRNTIESKMQEQSVGRGITAGGLAPLTAGELRKNQIEQATVASKALTTSSTLEAIKGNIITAQNIADRAVMLKYGPLEEEQRVKLANLDLILKSPAFSLEEKNRAELRKRIEEERLRGIEEEKQNKKDVQTQVFEAIKNGLKDAVVIDRMQKSGSGAEAASIAAESGFGVSQLETQKFEEEKSKFVETQKLAREKMVKEERQANRKFEEDRRQFGLEYALKQKALNLKEIKKETEEIEEIEPKLKLSATEIKQTREKVESSEELISLATKYKDIVDKYGFTNRIFGNKERLGEVRSLRAQMTAAYKDAKKLGTLDEGVLTLMEQIIGIEPTSGILFPIKNIFGGRAKTIVSQMDTLIDNTKKSLNRDKKKLGLIDDFTDLFSDEELLEAEDVFNSSNSFTTPSGFNPSDFFK